MRPDSSVIGRRLALGVVALALAGCGTSAVTSSPPAVPSSSPSAAPSPTPSPVLTSASPVASSPSPSDPLAGCTGSDVAVPTYETGEELAWQRLPADGAFDDSIVLDVAASSGDGAPAFVAVGSTRTDPDPQAPWSPAAWTSADGIEWVAASEPPSARTLVQLRDGYLSWDGASVWRSADGDRWEDLGIIGPDATTPRWLEIVGFEQLGSCVIAAGYEELPDEEGAEPLLRTWLSADGSAWTEVEPQLPADWDRGRISGMTSAPDGLVAWGARPTDAGFLGVTLRTRDGRTWELGGEGLEAENYAQDYISGIAVGPTGLVAVGGLLAGEAGSDPPSPAAWTSQDGLRWTRNPVDADGGGFHSVSWDGARFLATRRPGLEAEVWSSPDGTDWSLMSSAPDVAKDGAEEGCTGSAMCPTSSVVGLAAGQAGVVAFGYRDAEGTNFGVLWAAPRGQP
jgi:hypothetical protein